MSDYRSYRGVTPSFTLPPFAQRRSNGEILVRRLIPPIVGIAIGLIAGLLLGLAGLSALMLLALPILVLVLLIVWLWPDRDAPIGPYVGRILLGLMLVLGFWPSYLALRLPGLPWISPNRLFGFALLMMLLFSLGTCVHLRRHLAATLAAVHPAGWLYLTFVLAQLLSIAFHPQPFAAVTQVFNFHLAFSLPFFAALATCQDVAVRERVFTIMVAVYTFQFALGFGEAMTQSIFWAPYVPDVLRADPELVNRILSGASRAYVDVHRAQGTFTTPLSYAELFALLMPFVFAWGARSPRLMARIVAGLLSFAGLVAVYLSQSRLGFIGVIAGTIVFWAAWVRIYTQVAPKTSLVKPIAILSASLGSVMLIALTFVSGRLRVLVWGAEHTTSSDESRVLQYDRGFQKLLQWPFGYGPGQAGVQIDQVGPNGYNIDTYYMLIALDTGVIGFICFYSLLAIIAAKSLTTSLRQPRSIDERAPLLACASATIAFLLTKSVLSQEDTHSIMFIILGLAVSEIARLRAQASALVPHARDGA